MDSVEQNMMSSYIDAINVRLVNGTLRMDLIVISGQEEDKFTFSKKKSWLCHYQLFASTRYHEISRSRAESRADAAKEAQKKINI